MYTRNNSRAGSSANHGTPSTTAGRRRDRRHLRPAPSRDRARNGATPYTSQTDVSGQLEFWHFWGSPLRRNAIRRVIAGFNEHYPEIQITETFVPFGDIWTRAIAAVAAGSGMPDVLVDTVQLFDRAQNNIMTNLQELADRDNITEADFWPHAWAQANVEGNLYGLPYETDIRVLYYNKAQFADAGLDPETPPADWDALWTAADALDSIAENGSIERMGFHPLIGNIGLDQWAWCNGGEWQLEDGTPTINAPENVGQRGSNSGVTATARRTWTPSGNLDLRACRTASCPARCRRWSTSRGTSFLNFFNPNLSTEEGETRLWLGRHPTRPGLSPWRCQVALPSPIPVARSRPRPCGVCQVCRLCRASELGARYLRRAHGAGANATMRCSTRIRGGAFSSKR